MSADIPNPEAHAHEVSRRVTKTINRLLSSPMPEVRDIAENVVTRIRMGEIDYTDPTPHSPCPSLTAFALTPDGPKHMRRFKPAIVLKPAAILTSLQEHLDADMVRTFAIADQYPTRFTDNYSDIYDRALGTQKRWLNAEDITEGVPYDPRLRTKDEFKRELLGENRFFCDAGMTEWNLGVRSPATAVSFLTQIPHLKSLNNNAQIFINTREAFTDNAYEHIQNQPLIFSADVETRRRIIGMYYVGKLLMEFDKAKMN